MNGGKQPRGYTIVEVMIVLAVSGVLFVVAATFISGKQQKTSFQAGVNEMASRLQDTLEQVNDGQFSDIPFSCVVTGTGPYNYRFLSSSSAQGTQDNCTFVAKVYYFDNPTSYYVFSLAGIRTTASGAVIQSLAEAYPTPVIGTGIDLTQQLATPQNLSIVCVTTSTGSSPPSCGSPPYTNDSAIGFSQGFGTAGTSASSYATGSQSGSFVAFSTTPGRGESILIDRMTIIPAVTQATVCLTDGTRYAHISVGSNNNQLSVTTQLGLSQC